MFSLRLIHKIASMAALGVLGLAAVGAIYWSGETKRAAAHQDAANATTARLLMLQILGQMLEARRAEKDFLLRAEESHATRLKTVAEETASNLSRLETLTSTTGQEQTGRQTAAVQTGFATYVEHFNTMAAIRRDLGLTQDAGLEGTLRKSVHAIESMITEPALNAVMLSMRRNEKDFMAHRSLRPA
jgi:methyl-accepting chemotaxis protein